MSTQTSFAGNVVWASGGGTVGDARPGVTTGDPKLARVGGLYRRQAISSALIGKGSADADIFGRTRPATPTVGAEAWSNALPKDRPLTRADVGPGSTTKF